MSRRRKPDDEKLQSRTISLPRWLWSVVEKVAKSRGRKISKQIEEDLSEKYRKED